MSTQTEAKTDDLQHELDTEPAETIGGFFADKKMVRTFVTAAVSLLALAFRWVVDDAVIENLVTVISMGGMLVTMGMAQWEASKRAKAQAKETRAHVYAPATVEKIRQELTAPAPRPRVAIPKGEGVARFTRPGK